MNLLSRRRTMGNKKSEQQLIEVDNISTWMGYVTDDARQNGWTLEKPYYFSLNGFATGFDVHGLSDADFMCMDVLDNDTVGTKNLYIPAIGKYSIGMTGTYYNSPIESSEAQQYTWNVENQAYPQTPVYDSLGRKWIKVAITQYDTSRKVICKSQDLSIYYCAESDLGQIFADRRWEKHYTQYPSVKAVLNSDTLWRENGGTYYFNGLRYNNGMAMMLSDSHYANPVEAYLNWELQGYLIEMPDDVDQMILNYQGCRAYISVLGEQNGEVILMQEFGWQNDSYAITNVSYIKWVLCAIDISPYPETGPEVSVLLGAEW